MTSTQFFDEMTYLDRGIRLFAVEDPGEIGDASSSTLFLGLYRAVLSPTMRMRVIQAIQDANPLAVRDGGARWRCQEPS
jgi:hypothetical protein